jgi:hypothetical protein
MMCGFTGPYIEGDAKIDLALFPLCNKWEGIFVAFVLERFFFFFLKKFLLF